MKKIVIIGVVVVAIIMLAGYIGNRDKVCKKHLGLLTMDKVGYTVGKVTERDELLRLLKNGKCDKIEITYFLNMVYGDDIPKKLVYIKSKKLLIDIFTRTDVKEAYTVESGKLIKFLENGGKNYSELN